METLSVHHEPEYSLQRGMEKRSGVKKDRDAMGQ